MTTCVTGRLLSGLTTYLAAARLHHQQNAASSCWPSYSFQYPICLGNNDTAKLYNTRQDERVAWQRLQLKSTTASGHTGGHCQTLNFRLGIIPLTKEQIKRKEREKEKIQTEWKSDTQKQAVTIGSETIHSLPIHAHDHPGFSQKNVRHYASV